MTLSICFIKKYFHSWAGVNLRVLGEVPQIRLFAEVSQLENNSPELDLRFLPSLEYIVLTRVHWGS